MSKITIRPLEKPNWAGRVRFMRTTDSIGPGVAPNGGVQTGLNAEDQKSLEEAFNMAPGALAPHADFWKEYRIVVADKPIVLDLDSPKGKLDYLFLKAHKRVANSVNELENWPEAEYVIYDLEEDAKKENKKTRVIKDAYLKFSKMTNTEMKDALKLFGERTEDTSNEHIENLLAKKVQSQPEDFLAIVGDKDFKTKVLVDDLLRAKALKKVGTHYLFGSDPIGHDLESTILYLNDPKNQTIKASLIKKVESFRKQIAD